MRVRDDSFSVTELRGLACLLLVAYHVVGVPGAGMRVPDDSLYRYLTDSLAFIRMPLFTVISGLVYAGRPVRAAELGAFASKKLRRLLLPFLVVSTLFFAMQSAVPGTNRVGAPDEWWHIYLYPYAHFWYLQALLWIFALVGVLDAHGVLRRPRPFAAITAAAFAACLALPDGEMVFGINNAVYLLPYFLAGVAVTRFPAVFADPGVRRAVMAGLVGALVLQQASLAGAVPLRFDGNHLVAVVCGVCGALVLLRVMPRSAVFRRIGTRSYAIYLHHAFFTAAARLVLVRLGADDIVVFGGSLLAGLLGPMAVEAAAGIRPWTRTALVGRA